MKKLFALILTLLSFANLYAGFSTTYSDILSQETRQGDTYTWKKENIDPFDELLLSWNAKRPMDGSFLFLVRVKVDDWSPWMHYSEWGKERQASFDESHPASYVKIFQDTVDTQKGKTATGFEVKVVAQNGSDLKGLDHLFVTTSRISQFTQSPISSLETVRIPNIQGQSQMILDHPRGKDMCSPTSTSTVVNFLLGKKEVDPLYFASQVRDMGFDIYGNWALNVAEAYHALKGKYSCHLARLEGFSELHAYLKQNLPVVVSVKGEIPGAVKPYNSGHLMVVTGFDAEAKRVICIDSAFGSNEKTEVSYALEDFLKAWGTRKNLAYVFELITSLKTSRAIPSN